jgi:hypothetical protein
MITIYSVLKQGLGTAIVFFKCDSETITCDREDIKCDND